MKRIVILIFLATVWIGWVVQVVYLLNKEVISRNDLTIRTGNVVAALCVNTRFGDGIKFKAMYNTDISPEEDYFSLPEGLHCNQKLLDRILKNEIQVAYYKNQHVGIRFDGYVIKPVSAGIEEYNNSNIAIYFSLFVVLSWTIVSLLKLSSLAKVKQR